MQFTLFVLALALSAMSSGRTVTQGGDSDVPLSVLARPNAETIDIEVTNHGTKTAAAWSLKFASPSTNGRLEGGSIDQDLYPLLVIPGKGPIGPLAPNRSAVVLTLPASAYSAASFTAIAVVYEDGTAAGDEERIRAIFQRRAADAEAWKGLSATLKRLERGRITPAAVETTLEQIEATPREDVGHKRRLVVTNMRNLLKSQSPSELESGLKDLISMASKYAEGSALHSVRR